MTRRAPRSARRFLLLAPSICAVLAACSPQPREYLFSGPAMGTQYNIKVVAVLSARELQAVDQAIRDVLAALDTKLSNYRPDSELSRFNQDTSCQPFALSPETEQVFRIALRIARESGGAFDITVGPLVDAWGFGPHPAAQPPGDAELAALRERVGYQHLEWAGEHAIRKKRPEIQCDFSALGPGYGVDCIARALEQRGIHRYMAELGGEVLAKGLNAGGVPWRIGIERPVSGEEESIQRTVHLRDMAVATSGDYRNYREVNGVRYSHHIDPATGRPLTHPLASVSVLHPHCAEADAYATTLMVLGPDKGLAFAEAQHLPAYFIVHKEGGFEERATPDFAQYEQAR